MFEHFSDAQIKRPPIDRNCHASAGTKPEAYMSLACLDCPTEYNFVIFRDSHSIFDVRIRTLGCFICCSTAPITFHEPSWSPVQVACRLDSKQTSILTLTLACTSDADVIPFVTWTHSQAICRSPIIDDNCQGVDYCRPSRCLNWLIQILPFAPTHLMYRP